MIDGQEKETKAFVPDEIIVKFKSDKKAAAAAPVKGVKSMEPVFKKKTAASIDKIYRVKLEKNTNVEDTIKKFKADPDVEYAEPNLIMKVQMVPNDPFYSSRSSWGQPYDDLWGLKPDKMDAERAWDISQGEGAVVAVIDTGVNYTHPDLAANAWVNPGEDLNHNGIAEISDLNGIDDDQNGYADDIRGWNFDACSAEEPSPCGTNNPLDGNGHGTHVAGTIAAVGNNGQGVIGVAPKAKIMALKGLGDNGTGTILNLSRAVIYAVDNGAHITNNSWGGAGSSQTLTDVFDYAASRGVLNFAAAGNENEDASGYTPAGIPGVIAVGASTERDERASFSNFGSKVEMAAPGGGYENELGTGRNDLYNILSAGVETFGQELRVANGYYRLAGTSMACPHAAGAAALLRSRYPQESNLDIRMRLVTTLDRTLGNGSVSFPGRINVYKAMTAVAAPFFKVKDVSLNVRSGDGDLIPERGEEVELVLELENLWRDAASVTLTLNPPPAGIESISVSQASLGNAAGGQVVGNASTPFVFKVGDYGVRPADVHFTLVIRSAQGEQSLDLPVRLGYAAVPTGNGTLPGSNFDFSGDYIVWDHFQLAHPRPPVMAYSLTENRVLTVSDPQIRSNQPRVSGQQICYRGFDLEGNNPQLFAYDVSSANTKPVAPQFYSLSYQISSPWIIADDYHLDGIRAINLSTGQDEMIFGGQNSDNVGFTVAIFGQKAAWVATAYRYGESEGPGILHAYDFVTRTVTVLEEIPLGHYITDLHMEGDTLVWADRRTGRYQVYTYDLALGTKKQITQDDTDHLYPSISGRVITWLAYQNGQWDVFAYHLDRGRQVQVTSTAEIENKPIISGTKIAWVTPSHVIYLAELPPFNTPPIFHPIPPQTVAEGDTLSFVLSAEDPDGDTLVYRMIGSPPPLSILYAGDHRFVWTTGVGHEGHHTAEFTVTDGEFTRSQTMNITVTPICPFVNNMVFVYRQYLDLLHRQGDPAGMQSWIAELDAGRLTRQGLVLNFLNGVEFGQNESFVIRAYSLLGRLADKQGFLGWNGELKSDRVSKEGIAGAFITSSEFVMRYGTLSNRDFVRRLYLNVLRRDPDAAGWNGWTSVLDNQTYTRAHVALQFLTSPEAGTKNSNRDFVQALYLCLLQRQAADTEFNSWLSLLSDRYSRAQMISVFLNSVEYESRFNCT